MFQHCEENSKKCIPLFWFCDGDLDCPFGSDELNCPCDADSMTQCVVSAHNVTQNVKCVPITWVCDGSINCLNLNDEINKKHKNWNEMCGLQNLGKTKLTGETQRVVLANQSKHKIFTHFRTSQRWATGL